MSTIKAIPGDDQRGDLAHMRCKSAADAALAAEQLGGMEVREGGGYRRMVCTYLGKASDTVYCPVWLWARCSLVGAVGTAARADVSPRPAQPWLQVDGSCLVARSQQREVQDLLRSQAVAEAADRALAAAKAAAKPGGDTAQKGGGRGRPRSRSRSRSRGRSWGRGGDGTFRGLEEDAPLVPVRVVLESGVVEWQLCTTDVFVR